MIRRAVSGVLVAGARVPLPLLNPLWDIGVAIEQRFKTSWR